MFNVTPYSALHYSVRVKDGSTTMKWEDCRVIGIDASSAEPLYLIEVPTAAGEFFLKKVDFIKKPAPSV